MYYDLWHGVMKVANSGPEGIQVRGHDNLDGELDPLYNC